VFEVSEVLRLKMDGRGLRSIEAVTPQADGIPSLAAEDRAARKILAILDRTERRGFTDLWPLWALSTRLGVHCLGAATRQRRERARHRQRFRASRTTGCR
jgi:hypothetical protein